MTAATAPRNFQPAVERSQDALVVSLRLVGWTAMTALATLGIASLTFLVLGNFTLGGMILQIDNLTSRYLDADPARQSQFHSIVCGVLTLAFVLIGFFRRASFCAAFDVSGDKT